MVSTHENLAYSFKYLTQNEAILPVVESNLKDTIESYMIDISAALMIGVSGLIYFKEVKYYKDLFSAKSSLTPWSASDSPFKQWIGTSLWTFAWSLA